MAMMDVTIGSGSGDVKVIGVNQDIRSDSVWDTALKGLYDLLHILCRLLGSALPFSDTQITFCLCLLSLVEILWLLTGRKPVTAGTDKREAFQSLTGRFRRELIAKLVTVIMAAELAKTADAMSAETTLLTEFLFAAFVFSVSGNEDITVFFDFFTNGLAITAKTRRNLFESNTGNVERIFDDNTIVMIHMVVIAGCHNELSFLKPIRRIQQNDKRKDRSASRS